MKYLVISGVLAVWGCSGPAPVSSQTQSAPTNRCQNERFSLVIERATATCASGIAEEDWSYVTYMDAQPEPIDSGVLTFFCRDGYSWAHLAGHDGRKMRLDRIGGGRYRLSQVGFFIANLQCVSTFE